MERPLPHHDLTAQLLALRPDVARRVARRRRGGRTEDRTQEAMLLAHGRLGTYRQSLGGLRPWVLGIAQLSVCGEMQKGWRRRGAHVPWQALGHGCKGLPPQPMMFAKEEPLDDHHHYRL
jgi:DNA-directed RNA polymerase specialized sigma24 family protein